MTGRKITIRNVGNNTGVFAYQTLSSLVWQYQVEILPGQTKTIFCVDGTFYYNTTQSNIIIVENTPFPPDGLTTTTTTTSPPIPNQNKSLIQISTISDTNTNWEYSVLNYGTNSIVGPVDFGLDSMDWNFVTVYTTLNGWMVLFNKQSNNNIKHIEFVDKDGNIVYTYTATTTDTSYDNLDNRYVYYTDYDNLKCIFTDFANVSVYNIPSNFDEFYIDNNYDASNSVGAVFFQRIGDYSTYLLFKPTGYTLLYNWDNTSYGVDSIVYTNSNYFVIIVYSLDNDKYSFFNIYNNNGVLIKSENLLTNNTTSINSISNTSTTTNPITFNGYVTGGTTNGDGYGATFHITISSGNVTECTPYGRGNDYQINDTITFDGTIFSGSSGADNITITATSLGDFQYTNYDANAFGDGKINLIMWNNSDNKIPYLIYVYDGPNNVLHTTNHDHNFGSNGYYDWWTYYWGLNGYSDNGQPSQDIHIQFNDNDGVWNDNLYSVDYCDIVSWYNSNPGFEVNTFAENANYDYYISLNYYYIGESLILYSNRDTNFINYEVFQQGQYQTVQVVQTNSLDSWYFDNGWAGQKFVTEFYLSGVNETLTFIHNYDGTYIDDLYTNAYGEGSQFGTEYNSMVFLNNHDEKTFYWNSSVSSIVLLDEYFDSWNSENSYYTTLNHNQGNFVIFNNMTQQARILTKDSISPVISLSNSVSGYSVRIGKNLMAYQYQNPSNKIVVKVYNLSGVLLTTVTTNEDSVNYFRIQENRVYLSTESGNNYVHYLITSQGYKKVTTTNESSFYEYNDSI